MLADLQQTLVQLIEKVERRFYGKYRGFVVDNEDPENLGRIKVTVPSILGTEVVTGWATPCTPYGGAANQGCLFVPEVDAGVWVEFEEGDLEFPIWIGTFWSKPDGESELPRPNDAEGAELDEVQSPVTCKIIKTLKGHTIQLEDKDDEEMVVIMQVNDDVKRNIIKMNSNGITIMQRIDDDNINTVEMTEAGIKLTDFSANFVEMTESGIKLTDFTENCIDMNDGSFTITAKVAFTIDASGQAVEIKGDTVDFTKA